MKNFMNSSVIPVVAAISSAAVLFVAPVLADHDTEEALLARLAPVGSLNIMSAEEAAAAAAAQPAASTQVAAADADGETVYNTACLACHAAGVAGSPKTGDADAWAPRIAQGLDVLVRHAIEGYQGDAGVMPARGGNPSLSDAEVSAAVEFMVDASS